MNQLNSTCARALVAHLYTRPRSHYNDTRSRRARHRQFKKELLRINTLYLYTTPVLYECCLVTLHKVWVYNMKCSSRSTLFIKQKCKPMCCILVIARARAVCAGELVRNSRHKWIAKTKILKRKNIRRNQIVKYNLKRRFARLVFYIILQTNINTITDIIFIKVYTYFWIWIISKSILMTLFFVYGEYVTSL